MLRRHFIADWLEVETLAAADDGGGQLVRLGRGKKEFHVRRRLLEGFEQRVEGRSAQHMHLVDQVDAELAARGQEADVFPQLAHLLDTIVARPVDLEHVETVAGRNFTARVALAAGSFGRPVHAIERLGKNARGRGLAHPARADEEVSVGQPPVLDRIAQRPHHGVLTEDLLEQLRTVFAGEDLVAHGAMILSRAAAGCGGINAGSGVSRSKPWPYRARRPR